MTLDAGSRAPSRVPANATADGDGIVVGSGPVIVEAYIDFLCPFCRQFEQQHGPALSEMVDDDLIQLVYHPLGFLDGLSTTRYSSRAAAASGCASDGGRFVEYAHALFAEQPPEGGPGLSDDQLGRLGIALGFGEDFPRCIRAGVYLEWVEYVTARAIARGVSGTPSVMVAGVPVPANAHTIAVAVAAALGIVARS
jgi:protein-disulfide isomerase